VISVRAEDGARKIYRSITDKKADDKKADDKKVDDRKPAVDRKAPDHTGSIGVADNDDPGADATPRDTLTPDDLAMDWRLPPTP
jgi:hypothetical protein